MASEHWDSGDMKQDNWRFRGRGGVNICLINMIDSDQRPASNRHPLTSLSQIQVQFKGILKLESFPNSKIYGRLVRVMAYVSDFIWRLFEKVRNGHRFENWMLIWRFEKGHRFEVQMSVTKSEMDLRIGRRSESYKYVKYTDDIIVIFI